MKTRIGFISNSSTTSFIILARKSEDISDVSYQSYDLVEEFELEQFITDTMLRSISLGNLYRNYWMGPVETMLNLSELIGTKDVKIIKIESDSQWDKDEIRNWFGSQIIFEDVF